MQTKNCPKIVLTGGPCAGKSTIAEVIGKAFGTAVVLIPESASLLFRGGFPRWLEPAAQGALQRAIYRTQLELEVAFHAHYSCSAFILDRGTLDGAAYWPSGPEGFFKSNGTTLESELKRYDQVIYLESADAESYESGRSRNPNRLESWDEAQALDEVTKNLWKQHPNFIVIHEAKNFSEKISAVLRLVEAYVKN